MAIRQRISPRILALVAGALLVLGLVNLRSSDTAIVAATRGAGFDLLQRIWPREQAEAQPVRIVDIDEASLQKLGQWPWPRSSMAELSTKLFELGAAAVAFDIVFPEPDRLSPRRIFESVDLGSTINPTTLPDTDQAFAQAIVGKPVILAFATTAKPNAEPMVLKSGFAFTGLDATSAVPQLNGSVSNIAILSAAATGIGGINLNLAANQGIARQVPMLWSDGARFAPALSLEALRVAQGANTILVHGSPDQQGAIESITVGDIEIPTSEAGLFQVYFRPNTPEMYVSAAEILSTDSFKNHRSKIEGHIVFVGTSAIGLLDTRTSALGETIPGVSIHAQVTEQILSQTFLTRPEWAVGAEYLAVIILGLGTAALSSFLRPITTLAATSMAAFAIIASAIIAFRSAGLLLDATFPLFALAASTLTAIALRLLVTDRDSRKLRNAFAHYVAPSVLQEIERNPQNLKLGGEMRDVTVMFMDIENFTPLGEKLDPVGLVALVNKILDAGSRAILSEKGTIDKYIGDAIMAFWNAPVAIEDHQFHAAKAALAIRKAVSQLNDDPEISKLLQHHHLPKLAVRIGIASGPACVGNMGSSNRFDYSVLGETVNIASRVENACKDIGCDIAIAGPLSDKTKDMAILDAGHRALKGKSTQISLFAILGGTNIATQDSFMSFRRAHDEMIEFIQQKKSAPVAKSLLAELADEHPTLARYFEHLHKRIADYDNR